PTETTVYATFYPVKSVDSGKVPIGSALSNVQLYILDAQDQLAGIGVVGEICIGGDGVALGYVNQPELTNQKFTRNPFVADDEQRLYRTGDLGRWLPDGTIDFVGRTDDQVKIRGYRIELGEVEAVLQNAPGVVQAAVAAREDGYQNQKLVGYVTTDQAYEEISAKAYLGSKLPDYMVPAVLVVLDSFPLTPNGKVDKKALPEPNPDATQADTYVAPRDAAEEQLATIWARILGTE
ncbi:MAG TPA: AMP-binding protein, partial [Hymenobacter sp.]|nr:AMP-binding protein [Hymenobacter sp.]